MAVVGLTVAQAQNVTTSVQGVLRDPQGRSVDDGTYELTFKLYTQATGGTEFWTETQSNVSVSHGVFSVKLGAVNPISGLSASQTYYLGVTAPGAGELLPRVELTKTYAANTAGSVTGTSNVVPSSGNVGIGTTNPTAPLEVSGDVKISSGGKLYFPDNTFLASAQSGTAEQVTASGDANIIADNDNNGSGVIIMKTGASEKVRITDIGRVGIGTTNPSQKLEVYNGNMVVNGDGGGDYATGATLQITSSNTNKPYMSLVNATNSAFTLGADADAAIIGWDANAQNLVFRRNIDFNTFPNTGSVAMTILGTNGNVGIGITDPSNKLEVAGSIKGGQSSGDAFLVGDDSKLVDINVQNTFGVIGIEDPTRGGIRFGNNGPTLWGNTNYMEMYDVPTVRYKSPDAGRTAFQIENTSSNRTWEISTGGNNNPSNQGGNGGFYIYQHGAGPRMFLTPDGGIYRSDGGAFWNSFSDKRMKKDISSYNSGLDLIKQLNPVKFKYNGKGGSSDDGKEHISFIAQDIEQIPELAPLMVTKEKMKLEETDTEATDLLSLNTSALQFILVNAIKEQQKQIEELNAEIQELKKK